MKAINKHMIIGNLGADPETRFTPKGTQITTFSVATTDTYKDSDSGENKESTEWHRVVTFGKLAEIAQKYLTKGQQVYVEGRSKTNSWADKDNKDFTHYRTEIHCQQLQMLGKKPAGAPDDAHSDE